MLGSGSSPPHSVSMTYPSVSDLAHHCAGEGILRLIPKAVRGKGHRLVAGAQVNRFVHIVLEILIKINYHSITSLMFLHLNQIADLETNHVDAILLRTWDRVSSLHLPAFLLGLPLLAQYSVNAVLHSE